MGWASGVYTRIFGSSGWQADKAALIKMLSSRHDSHDQDISDGLNTLRTELRGETLSGSSRVLTSVAGTNTITASLTSATPAGTLTAYSSGLTVTMTPANSNTGATTLNVNSLGALDVMNTAGGPCTGSELIAGVAYSLVLDAGADDWIIVNAAKPPESIVPTWTGNHKFTSSGGALATSGVTLAAAVPAIYFQETVATANNKSWRQFAAAEQLLFQTINDAENSTASWLTVDRTGTTVDKVHFPTTGSARQFMVGSDDSVTGFGGGNGWLAAFRNSGSAIRLATTSAGSAIDPVAYIQHEATSGNNKFISFLTDTTTTERGNIDFNRAGTAVRYNTTSDGRLKRNVRAAPSALDLVLSIPVDSFQWIERSVEVTYGFVAQKLYAVVPDAVSGGDDETKTMGIDRSALVPMLTKALQESISMVRDLSSRVSVLEGAAAGGKR